MKHWVLDIPWKAPRLHMICSCHIIRPDIILPLDKTQNPTVNFSHVHTNSHVQVNTCSFTHTPAVIRKQIAIIQKGSNGILAYNVHLTNFNLHQSLLSSLNIPANVHSILPAWILNRATQERKPTRVMMMTMLSYTEADKSKLTLEDISCLFCHCSLLNCSQWTWKPRCLIFL